MKMLALTRPANSDHRRKLKGHIAHRNGAGVRPLCGGGRGGKAIHAWDADFMGIAAVTCKRCLQRAVRLVELARERAAKGQCIHCGCNDARACVTNGLPCHWVSTNPPICSACAPASRARFDVAQIFEGSNGKATKALYQQLDQFGPIGRVAVNLFRAQKCSSRAKVYRGGRHRSDAYDRKNWSLANLCAVLVEHGEGLNIRWGWKEDPAQEFHNWVLYVELPTGQVSFHAATRGKGPDYPGEWDQSHASAQRIIAFVASVLAAQ
jgi:hypothetical protein